MTLHQLKVFFTIVKLNGVAQAAKALHISQPSVSGVVQDLQNELGVKLFERLGNKRHLTEAGKRVLQRAEAVLANAEAIKDDLDELKGLKKGKISVGSAGIGTPLILQAVAEFKERYPGVDVSLSIQGSEVLHKRLLDGEIDVAILGRNIESPLTVAVPYREEELVVFASPKHPLAKKRSVPLKLLAKEPLITFERSDPVVKTIEQRFAAAGCPFTPRLEINLALGSRDAIKSAVSEGLGIGFLTKCHILGEVKAGRLKILNVPELKLKRTMYIAFHKNRADSHSVRSFVDFLKGYKSRR